jgi:hypothetical protein
LRSAPLSTHCQIFIGAPNCALAINCSALKARLWQEQRDNGGSERESASELKRPRIAAGNIDDSAADEGAYAERTIIPNANDTGDTSESDFPANFIADKSK